MFQAFSHLEQTETKNERRIMKPDRISHNNRHHSFPQNQDAEDVAAAANKNHGEKSADTSQDIEQFTAPTASDCDHEPAEKPRAAERPRAAAPPRPQQSDSA
jgi:hypothetical protein